MPLIASGTIWVVLKHAHNGHKEWAYDLASLLSSQDRLVNAAIHVSIETTDYSNFSSNCKCKNGCPRADRDVFPIENELENGANGL